METLLRIGLSNAVAATALALLAATVSRLVRRPAVAHVLWVIVLLKLITPPLFAVPIHFAAAPGHAEATLSTVEPFDGAGELTKPTPVKPMAPFPLLRAVALAAAVAWAAGTVIVAVSCCVRLRRFAMLLRFAQPAPADIQSHCRRLALQLRIPRCPPVYLLPGQVCPMLWAPLLRPRVLVPAALWDRLSLRQRATLLLHELAHLKRGDHFVRALELAALALFWWHPVAWWARYELRVAEEQCCDAWVTWALPAGSRDYATALVEAVEFASISNPVPMLPALASGIGEFRHLKRRLIMIQHGTGNRTLGKAGALIACCAAALLPLTVSRAQQPAPAPAGATTPTTQPDIDPALRKQLARTLPELHFDAVGLSDVIDFLKDVSGVRFEVDWDALKDVGVGRNMPITAKLQNVKLSEAISAVVDQLGKRGTVTWRPAGKVVRIGLAEKKQPPREKRSTPAQPG